MSEISASGDYSNRKDLKGTGEGSSRPPPRGNSSDRSEGFNTREQLEAAGISTSAANEYEQLAAPTEELKPGFEGRGIRPRSRQEIWDQTEPVASAHCPKKDENKCYRITA